MNVASHFKQPGAVIGTQIIADLNAEFGNYKYTVYRCAGKLVTLQKRLFTAQIPYKLVLAVLHRHGLGNSESNLMILPFQLTSLVHDIYFASEKIGHFSKFSNFDLNTASTTISNFFWNVFDPHRRHSISLLEIKVTFILLCKLPNNDEFVFEFFKLICDRKSKYISKFNFECLLNCFTKILSYIGESSSYGVQNALKVVEQCFARCHSSIGLSEHQFNNLWTVTQTRFLIYANLIITVKRIEQTENLVHNNSCASCGMDKIIGIRFKCHTCKNLSMCMKCFASGYFTPKHQPGHRVYEMFGEDEPPKKISHYFAKFCSVFFRVKKNTESDDEKGFCNINGVNAPNETDLVITPPSSTSTDEDNDTISDILRDTETRKPSIKCRKNLEPSIAGLTATASNATNASARLQSIIDRLLIQNFKIEQYLRFVPTATPEQISEFLKSHQKFLNGIINEMRNFKATYNSMGSSLPTSSTPNNSAVLNQAVILDNSNESANNLTHSINGADINRSYLEANKSDYSVNDVSVWFNQRKVTIKPSLNIFNEAKNKEIENSENRFVRETNFRFLLQKVKEIFEDSFRDTSELAAATQNLENVLDSITKSEESRRRSMEHA